MAKKNPSPVGRARRAASAPTTHHPKTKSHFDKFMQKALVPLSETSFEAHEAAETFQYTTVMHRFKTSLHRGALTIKFRGPIDKNVVEHLYRHIEAQRLSEPRRFNCILLDFRGCSVTVYAEDWLAADLKMPSVRDVCIGIWMGARDVTVEYFALRAGAHGHPRSQLLDEADAIRWVSLMTDSNYTPGFWDDEGEVWK